MSTRPETGPEPDIGEVMSERARLINLAYRMLGSLADAEDVVQETYSRWYAMGEAKRHAIESPPAWLTTVASRICLDQLRSARSRRERYVGEWIPEPVPGPSQWISGRTSTPSDPAEHVTLDESVSMAFLVVLDAMTPAERVSFILHDVFRYPFAQIAQIVGRTPAACRQLASSGRRRLAAAHTAPSPSNEQARIVRKFKHAWATQDIDALLALLDPDATAIADGGGRVVAAAEPIEGAEAIVGHYLQLMSLAPAGVTLQECLVNGHPGLVQRYAGAATTVFAFETSGERISRIWAVRNPDKLRAWQHPEPGDPAPHSLT
jgi:RNA polymerase sigma factor (sigma-70 family)